MGTCPVCGEPKERGQHPIAPAVAVAFSTKLCRSCGASARPRCLLGPSDVVYECANGHIFGTRSRPAKASAPPEPAESRGEVPPPVVPGVPVFQTDPKGAGEGRPLKASAIAEGVDCEPFGGGVGEGLGDETHAVGIFGGALHKAHP